MGDREGAADVSDATAGISTQLPLKVLLRTVSVVPSMTAKIKIPPPPLGSSLLGAALCPRRCCCAPSLCPHVGDAAAAEFSRVAIEGAVVHRQRAPPKAEGDATTASRYQSCH